MALKNALPLVLFFIVFVVLGAAAALNFASQKNSSTSSNIKDDLQPPKATFENGSVINRVFLTFQGAVPDAIVVKLGELLEFDARDGKLHDIARGGGDEFNQSHSHEEFGIESGKFGPDEGYRVSFRAPGVYHFHDHYNPRIFVAVVVYEEKKNSS